MKKIKDKSKKVGIFVAIKDFLLKDKLALSCFMIGAAIGCLIMGLLWPDRIAKLKNGEQVIVTIGGQDFTADDYYNSLKRESGIDYLLNLIDIKVLMQQYNLSSEASAYAKEQSEKYYESYKSYYGYSKEEFLEANGFASEKEFLDYLEKNYYYEHYYEEYLKSLVTEQDIDKFYSTSVFGEREVHIFSSSKKDNDLEKVRSALKKGTKLDAIAKKYSSVSYNDVGTVSFKNASSYSDKFISELKKVKVNGYSKVFEDDALGYVVIYVSDAKEMPELKDIKDDVIKTISQNLSEEDSSLYYKAFIEFRKKNNIKFTDTVLAKEYDKYLKKYE